MEHHALFAKLPFYLGYSTGDLKILGGNKDRVAIDRVYVVQMCETNASAEPCNDSIQKAVVAVDDLANGVPVSWEAHGKRFADTAEHDDGYCAHSRQYSSNCYGFRTGSDSKFLEDLSGRLASRCYFRHLTELIRPF